MLRRLGSWPAGCWSQGQTEDEALENIKDAIKTYLETVEELGKDKELKNQIKVAGHVLNGTREPII